MKFVNSLLVALTFMFPLVAHAVQANRNPFVYTQPDGSQVTLRAIGDEYFHFYLTDDDKMVMSNADGYYFAVADATGRPVASQMLASDKANRTLAQAQMIDKVNTASLLNAASVIGNERRANRHAERIPRFGAPHKANAATSNWPSGIGLFPNNKYPVTGSPRALIVLVEYKDVSFTVSNAKDYFTGLASQKGFSQSKAHGSALDYFTASSNGKFTPQFDVLGPVTLSNNRKYYGGNDSKGDDQRPAQMVYDAIKALDSTTDFSVYDTDGDGIIDNVYVIYAGLGEASGGAAETIWPHSWDIAGAGLTLRVDGKYVRSYACSAEYLSTNLPDGIGTFCHEFSHVMGLPDLYTTDYNSTAEALTPHSYSLMDYGSYSNNSRTPPTYSIYERNAMGWCDIEVLEPGVPMKATLNHMLTSNKGYAIATTNSNEFFLLENRQLSDWDAYLPNSGMLVWHIDYDSDVWQDNSPNNTTHQYVDIVEAGGKANNNNSTTLKQYPFPGSKNVTSFTSTTTPALKSWAGTAIDVPLTNITESNGIITFDVCGGEHIDTPICNFSDAEVVSDKAVTVTLTAPSTAKTGDAIKYIYLYDDSSDIVDGTYSSPLTISKSCEFEYWLQRGDSKSEVTTIHFYIGETGPEGNSFTIVFKDNNSDSTTPLASDDGYKNEVIEGAEIASFNTGSTKIYPGKSGLIFSSSSVNGTLVLDLSRKYKGEYAEVVINAKTYNNNTTASISLNGSDAVALTSEFDNYAFTLTDDMLQQISMRATGRLYVKSITINKTATPDPEPDPEPDPQPDPDPETTEEFIITFSTATSENTQVSADNFTGFVVDGKEIATFGSATRVFFGNEGLKFGSSKGSGTMKLNINNDYQKEVSKIVVNAKAYGSDAAAINVNSIGAQTITTEFKDYTFDLNPSKTNGYDARANVLTTLTIAGSNGGASGNGRLYVKSIKMIVNSSNTSITDIYDETNALPVYYNLQGIRIDNPKAGQICIMRRGNTTSKVIVK